MIVAMVAIYQNYVSYFIFAGTLDPEKERRAKLVASLGGITFLVSIFGLVLVSVLILTGNTGNSPIGATFWVIFYYLVIVIAALVLNKYGYVDISSWMIVAAMVFGVFFANPEAAAQGKLWIYFVIPILFASGLISPSAAYLVATIQTVGVAMIFVLFDTSPKVLITPAAFYMIAAIAWVNARSHEQAFRELAKLDHLKSTFISDVSHELRTPINNLLAYSSLLGAGADGVTQDQIQDVLVTESKRAARLVGSILDVYRMEAVYDGVEMVIVDLAEVLRGLESVFLGTIKEKQLSSDCDFSFPEESLCVFGIPDQMETLFRNLIANAVNYTEGGGIKVKCAVEDDSVIVEVVDTGIGISENDIPFIFERFYRGENVSQTTMPGSGLGLSIARDIVAMHKGAIGIESDFGKGTTIAVELPRVDCGKNNT